MRLKKQVFPLIRSKTKPPLLSAACLLLSQLYQLAVTLRNFAYDKELLSSKRLPRLTISIGNIAACGMGKTPLVQKLAQELSSHKKVAILTRGYRSQVEKKEPQKLSLTDLNPASKYGDEPTLLAQKTPCPVFVGADRFRAGQKALADGVDCFLLDDGMQHRQLYRDIDIVLVDAKDPFAQSHFLPYGWLRDSKKRLRAASLIMTTSDPYPSDYESLKKQLQSVTDAPLVALRKRVCNPQDLPGKVGVFCGIAHPQQFLETLRDLNQEIIDTLILADHQAPSMSELQTFAKMCEIKGARALVCTEKDAVKLNPSLDLPLIPVEITLDIVEGEEHWQALLERIKRQR